MFCPCAKAIVGLHTLPRSDRTPEDVLGEFLQQWKEQGGISAELTIDAGTIKFHVRNILDKLRLHNRAEAIGYALRKRIDPNTQT
jgi:regulatory LuxR family protein